MAHGVKHSLVFGLDRNEVLALILVEVRNPLDCEVVGFRCARSPHDFTGIGVDVAGHFGARFFNGLFGLPAVGVRAACGVTELFAQVGNHFFGHARIHRGRCRVVKVDRKLQGHSLLLRPFVAASSWIKSVF